MSRESWHVSRNKGNQYLSFLPFLLSDVISVNTVRMGQLLVRRVAKVESSNQSVKNALKTVHDYLIYKIKKIQTTKFIQWLRF